MKKILSTVTAFAFFVFSSYSPVFGFNVSVVSGNATITKNGNTTTIIENSKTILQGNTSIAAGEVVKIIGSSNTLLRDITGSVTNWLGSLLAQGNIILINTQGIYIAQSANINVASLIASTLNIQNDAFLTGQYNFQKVSGTNIAQILNDANITVKNGGYLIFMADKVINNGTITAYMGSVAFGSGEKISLSFDQNGLVNMVVNQGLSQELKGGQITNNGTINAAGGRVQITAKLLQTTLQSIVNNTGIIEADRAQNNNGTIEFVADGGITNTGTIQGSQLNESGYTFDSSGVLNIGKGYFDNLDNAINVSGSISGTYSDIANINLTGAVTLTGDTTLQADSNGDGMGTVVMNDNSITGGGFNLTLYAGKNDPLDGAITGVNLLTLNSSTGGPVTYTSIVGGTNTFSVTTLKTNLGSSFTRAQGSGTSLDPYMIYSDSNGPGGLEYIGSNPTTLGYYYQLANNIDASDTAYWNPNGSNGFYGFNPIGNSTTPFIGTLNGNSFTISNLYINRSNQYDVGLLGVVDTNGTIENIGLTNINVTGPGYVGGLVGSNHGTIDNAYTTGLVTGNNGSGSSYSVGGLVGGNGGHITNSYSTATVSGQYDVGGLVGYNYGNIDNSFATGNVSANVASNNGDIGGLVGYSWGSTIDNSYATGSVSGKGEIGGLIGEDGNSTVSNSYATGNVTGTGNGNGIAGLVGLNNDHSTIEFSYATGSVQGGSGSSNVGGLAGANNYYSTVTNTYATGAVSGENNVGGLVGYNQQNSDVDNSFAIGNVTGTGNDIGGLVGGDHTSNVVNSYATGNVTGGTNVGGLIGYDDSNVTNSFAIGQVTGSTAGGLIGWNNASGNLSNDWWYTTSQSQAVGNGDASGTSEAAGVSDFFNPNQSVYDPWDIAPVLGHTWAISGNNEALPLLQFRYSTTITDAYQLQLIYLDLGAAYTLANNIDASPTAAWNPDGNGGYYGFEPIGSSGSPFTGTLSGNNETISNLFIEYPDQGYVGLFAQTTGATIENVNLQGVNVTGSYYVGGLIGNANNTTVNNASVSGILSSGEYMGGLVGGLYNSTIDNSYSSATVQNGDYTGGLTGTSDNSTITNSYATGNVSGQDGVGGLVGYTSNSIINNIYATGSVTGTGNYIGGLVGYNTNGTTIENAYATGNVTASSSYDVGGLVGGNNNSIISNSFALGNVEGIGTDVGGLVGENNHGNIINTYATGQVSGLSNVGGLIGSNTIGADVASSFAVGNVACSAAFCGTKFGGLIGYDDGSNTLTLNWWYNNLIDGVGNNSTLQSVGQWQMANAVTDFFSNAQIGSSDTGYQVYSGWNISYSILSPAVWGISGEAGVDGDIGGLPLLQFRYSTTITDAISLQLMYLERANSYTLANNIDASQTADWNAGYGFEPVDVSNNYFKGDFNGNGFVITDLTINRSGMTYVGLFGNTNGASIENVGLVNANIKGYNDVGGLVGDNNYGSNIDNNFVTGTVIGNSNVGGLVGYNYSSTIDNSYATATVTGGFRYVGGLVGGNGKGATINNSYATGNVSAPGQNYVGGLAGYNYGNSQISNSYATGNVLGASYVGGLVGYNGYTSTIDNSYATGRVLGSGFSVGGLVGGNTRNTGISDSFAVGNVYCIGNSCGSSFGGLIGYDDGSNTLTNNWWYNNQSNGIGDSISTPPAQNPGQWQMANSVNDFFTTSGIGSGGWDVYNGWDISNTLGHTWALSGNGEAYPLLQFNYSTTISNIYQLQLMFLDLGATYTLANNIDASGTSAWNLNNTGGYSGFESIGSLADPFTGTFNGNGYTIDNLTIDRPSTDYVGLFGASSGAIIENIGLNDASIYGQNYVGTLLGRSLETTITDAFAAGGSVLGANNIGGLLGGLFFFSTLSNAYAMVNVTGINNVGGLVGSVIDLSSVTNAFATGNVTGAKNVGGLLGFLSASSVAQTYASGNVNGSQNVGGLVGFAEYNSTIDNSFAVGNVPCFDNPCTTNTGGLIGYDDGESNVTLSNDDWYTGSAQYAIGYYTTDSGPANTLSSIGAGNDESDITNFFSSSDPVYAGWDIGSTIGYTWGLSGNDLALPLLQFRYSTDITDAYQLQLMYLNLSATYSLANNIDATITDTWNPNGSGGYYGFEPIGNGNNSVAFTGTFNGNNYSIENLYINSPSQAYVGLFSYTDGATIENVNLQGVNMTSYYFSGSLIGYADNTTINNASVSGGVISSEEYDGGLVGGMYDSSTIDNSYSTATVENGDYEGGLVGSGSNFAIYNSYATGNVSGYDGIGGLVGNASNAVISYSYATGTVTGTSSDIGGLVGGTDGGSNISYSYAAGLVCGGSLSGSSCSSLEANDVGGLVGSNSGSTIQNAYATGEVYGDNNVGGLVGVQGYGSIGSSETGAYATGNVEGNYQVGGLVGLNYQSTIDNTYATGNVVGIVVGGPDPEDLGGLVGSNRPDLSSGSPGATINDSYATGAVGSINAEFVGGLVGYNESDAQINNSFATGTPSGSTDVGGLVGAGSGSLSNDYSGSASTFFNSSNAVYSGWTFSSTYDSTGSTPWAFSGNNGALPLLQFRYSSMISDATQLQLMDLNLSANYTLTNNIDASSTANWNAGAGFEPVGNLFTGSFNGQNYVIAGLTSDQGSNNDIGLFSVTNAASIENVGLENVDISGAYNVGALVGEADNNTVIVNAYSTGMVTASGARIGGLVGDLTSSSSISNSYSAAAVSGNYRVGGLVGEVNGATVNLSFSLGNVSANSGLGGLAGYVDNGATIDDSYAEGSVTGMVGNIGGLVGYINASNIDNSYATGNAIATGGGTVNNIGGLVGETESGSTYNINNSFAIGTPTCDVGTTCSNVGGLIGDDGSSGAAVYNNDWWYDSESIDGIGNALFDPNVSLANGYSDFNGTSTNGFGGANSGGGAVYWDGGVIGGTIAWTFGDGQNAWVTINGTTPHFNWEWSATITTPLQLQNMALDPTYSYTLGKNIDASQTAYWNYNSGAGIYNGFIPISGVDALLYPQFTGTINGNGYTISGLTENDEQFVENGLGLFGNMLGVSITNLGLVNVNITDDNTTGSPQAASAFGFDVGSSLFNNIYSTGVVNGTSSAGGLLAALSAGSASILANSWSSVTVNAPNTNNVGGLIGISYGGDIVNSYATGAVTGENEVGDLLGVNHGTIINSYATGNVTGIGSAQDIGGLVGYNSGGTVDNSYATGSVSGNQYVGGLVGNNYLSTIQNSYATGSVSGNQYVGGLVGYNNFSSIDNSYATGSVTGAVDFVGGLVGYTNGSNIDDSFATGAVTGQTDVGGLVGFSTQSTIVNTFAIGSVTSSGGGAGGLVGHLSSSTISNSYAAGNVIASISDNEGGLVGLSSNSSIYNSYATGSVIGESLVGGLVGSSDSSFIYYSYATGNVTGSNDVGGLVGYQYSSTIDNSYARGSVTGNNAVGGLVGYNYSSNIDNSYSTGFVTSSGDVGGLVGYNNGGTVSNSFYDSQTSGQSDNVGNGIPESTADMTNSTLFTSSTWDFDGLWTIDNSNGGYPHLVWQNMNGNSPFIGGDSAHPFQISNVNQLQFINHDLNGYFQLAQNIDATSASSWNSDTGFMPIGNFFAPFLGTFDGQNYTITGLTINPGTAYVGLFGVASGATIKNVGLANVSITGSSYVGGLVGYAENNSLIDNSYVTGSGTLNSVTLGVMGNGEVGGLVGYLNDSTVNSSYSTADVFISLNAAGGDGGGLVGYSKAGSLIENSYATGNVTQNSILGENTGGLVGKNDGSTIESSYATGNVSGGSNVGGLVGYDNNLSFIDNSFAAAGNVSGSSNVGGLVGVDDGSGTIYNGWWYNNQGNGIGSGSPSGTWTEANAVTDFFSPETVGSSTGNAVYWENGIVGGTLVWDIGLSLGSTWAMQGDDEALPMLQFRYSTTITDDYQLQLMYLNLNGNYTLANNIDASETSNWNNGEGFDPIGSVSSFLGTFNGNNYTISNLFIDRPATTDVGLFGGTEGATIENLNLQDVNMTSDYYSGGLIGAAGYTTINNVSVGGIISSLEYDGGLVGDLYNSTIDNSYSTATVENGYGEGGLVGWAGTSTIKNSYATGNVAGESYLGGLVGDSSSMTLANDYATGSVTGAQKLGGLVGYSSGSSIDNSYATGSVTGTNNVGGLVGANVSGSTIENSFATGDVIGVGGVGGLTGLNAYGSTIDDTYAIGSVNGIADVGGLVGVNGPSSIIYNSYAAGAVSGTSSVGGLVGFSEDPAINSFYDEQTTGQYNSNFAEYGTPETTAVMQEWLTFGEAGWNPGNIWVLAPGAYPTFYWQHSYWTGAAGNGVFTDPANWSAGFPGAGDIAVINGQGLADVSISSSTTLAGLWIGEGYNQGIVDIGATLTLSGDYVQGAGTIANANSNNIDLAGDWFNYGNFNADASVVNLDGGNQTIGGQTTFFDFAKLLGGGDTLTFESGDTQTFVDMDLDGTSASSQLLIRSSDPGVQAYIDMAGTYTVADLNVQDSNAIDSIAPIDCLNGCTDSGNNINWVFGATAGGPVPVSEDIINQNLESNNLAYDNTSTVDGGLITLPGAYPGVDNGLPLLSDSTEPIYGNGVNGGLQAGRAVDTSEGIELVP